MLIAAWNINRGGHAAECRALLESTGADVWLLSECDWGMARSENINAAAEIAGGRFWRWQIEFIEYGLGNKGDRAKFAGQQNRLGLHGNAIVSRHKIGKMQTIMLDEGKWWTESGQKRCGARNAFGAKIGGVWYFVAHFENRGNLRTRAKQMRLLCEGIAGLDRVVVGGDFNSKLGHEPLFEIAERAGLEWRRQNQKKTVTKYPGPKLDWFFTRGIKTSNPRVVAPVVDGKAVSDHDLIMLEAE